MSSLPWGDITLASPLLILLAPVIALLALATKTPKRSALIPSLSFLGQVPSSIRIVLRKPILISLAAIFILGLTAAAVRPQQRKSIDGSVPRRNIILALDLSRSMGASNFVTGRSDLSRWSAVKRVVKRFIEARSADRIGIVVFGSRAFVQAPLTRDHKLLSDLINELSVGVAGDGTAIGDGLGLSLKRLRDVPPDSSAVILLTDGVSNSGNLDPLQAADIAQEMQIKVHTIGIGNPSDVIDGASRSIIGGGQKADFDDKILREISAKTGGVYFNAQDAESLARVYEQIDALEKTLEVERGTTQVVELFLPLCLVALLTYISFLLIGRVWLLKVP